MWFPGATGLEYVDANEKVPYAVVERAQERGLQFIEPREGWGKESRRYRTIYAEQESAAKGGKTGDGEAEEFDELVEAMRSRQKGGATPSVSL